MEELDPMGSPMVRERRGEALGRYPGQAGGQAIADVIFGHHNPGGKLLVTWYPEDYLRKAPMTNMAMRANPASGYPSRTYRFYTGPTILPFGHGLSYIQFTHSLAHAPEKLTVQLTGGHASAAAASSSFPNATRSAGAVRVAHARFEKSGLKKMMMKRYKLEKDLGMGSEVGHSKNKELAKRSPALVAMNRKFRMIHVVSSLASLMSFGSLAMHSWYLSSKLNL
ncbi:hypothetical protein SETIT_8G229800v2 [Setaria italica]|uniref:Glycoside hydrolase family 3 C-terminal domain-containing protein n=2 Tax=Setaria italica TaxID=4555 RepID=A0A368SAN8_SETIT|nr:hypothetical protein SETIT_8G229800v2 [Setaria italica]